MPFIQQDFPADIHFHAKFREIPPVGVVLRLDHVVLLFSARAVLRAEERTHVEARAQQRVRGEGQVRRHRRGVHDQAARGTAQMVGLPR